MARVIQRALHSWSRGQRLPGERDVYLESVALNLHGFYSAVERLFELVARHVDGALPTGEGWHHLVPQKMEPLIAALPGLWEQMQAELSAFADFLEELASASPTV